MYPATRIIPSSPEAYTILNSGDMQICSCHLHKNEENLLNSEDFLHFYEDLTV